MGRRVRKHAAGHRPRLRHGCARTVKAVPPIFRASRVSIKQEMLGAPAGFASWVDAVIVGPATVLIFCLAPIFQVVLIACRAWGGCLGCLWKLPPLMCGSAFSLHCTGKLWWCVAWAGWAVAGLRSTRTGAK